MLRVAAGYKPRILIKKVLEILNSKIPGCQTSVMHHACHESMEHIQVPTTTVVEWQTHMGPVALWKCRMVRYGFSGNWASNERRRLRINPDFLV